MTHHGFDICLLSVAQTARTLSVGRTTIYKLINEGRLGAVKIGRRTLIQRETIQNLIAGSSNNGDVA